MFRVLGVAATRLGQRLGGCSLQRSTRAYFVWCQLLVLALVFRSLVDLAGCDVARSFSPEVAGPSALAEAGLHELMSAQFLGGYVEYTADRTGHADEISIAYSCKAFKALLNGNSTSTIVIYARQPSTLTLGFRLDSDRWLFSAGALPTIGYIGRETDRDLTSQALLVANRLVVRMEIGWRIVANEAARVVSVSNCAVLQAAILNDRFVPLFPSSDDAEKAAAQVKPDGPHQGGFDRKAVSAGRRATEVLPWSRAIMKPSPGLARHR